ATSERVTALVDAPLVGVGGVSDRVDVDLTTVNKRILTLAQQQSDDIRERLVREGVTVIVGAGRFAATQPPRVHLIEVVVDGAVVSAVEADVVLIATGGTPRILDTAQPDGDRILSWRDVYTLSEMPEHIVVIGSGVTGAE